MIERIFRAGFVRRWHTNPDLAHTNDRIDAHSGRVARYMLHLWSETSSHAILYALTHDDGESVVGDAPATFKGAFETCRLEREARARLWPEPVNLTAEELARIKFCDRLDAYLWAKHHAPHTLKGDGWPEAIETLRSTGAALGLSEGRWWTFAQEAAK